MPANADSEEHIDAQLRFDLEMPAQISPAEANEHRDRALAAAKAAKGADKVLHLSLSGDGVTPCALQLLVATMHLAAEQDIRMELSVEADVALNAVEMS